MDGHIFITKHIGGHLDGVQGVRLFDLVTEAQSQPLATRFIVHMDSVGGEVDEAEKIASFLNRLQEKIEVIAYGEGLVASAASKIFLTITKRDASPQFRMMLHNPHGQVQGDAKYIETYLDEVRQIEKSYEKFYAEKLSIDEKTLSDLMDNELYIDYDKAKQIGVLNHSIEQPKIIFALNNQSINNLKKEKQMDEQTKSWFQGLFSEIKALMKKDTIKAIDIMSKEGVELSFPGETPVEGDAVNVPNGTYNFDYNDRQWVAIIQDGIVTSLTEVVSKIPTSELEALKSENEELKRQLAELQTAQTAEIQDLKKELEPLALYVKRHKEIQSKSVPKDEGEKFAPPKLDAIQASIEELKRKKAQRNAI